MDAYIYCAEIYCEECGRAIRERITKEGNAPANIDDETTFDSDEFPKGGGESDCPQHCGAHEDCINAYTPDGWECKVGAFLENDLTADGIEYVVNEWLAKPDNPVCVQWVKYYASSGYSVECEVNGVNVSLS